LGGVIRIRQPKRLVPVENLAGAKEVFQEWSAGSAAGAAAGLSNEFLDIRNLVPIRVAA
jgi:hypothetical protein